MSSRRLRDAFDPVHTWTFLLSTYPEPMFMSGVNGDDFNADVGVNRDQVMRQSLM